MKAAVLHSNNNIKYEEVETPIINNNEVKIQVKCSGICRSDINRVLYNKAHYYPIILGHEYSGIVVEVGSNVTTLSVGDHVVGVPLVPCFECDDCNNGNYSLCKNYSFIGSSRQGSFAQYIVCNEINAMKISKDISFIKATLFEPSTVALHALYQSKYIPNKQVAIIGVGSIGLFVMQWARIKGASNIVILESNPNKFNIYRKLGFNNIINTNDNNYINEVMNITNNKGFDYIYESAGTSETMKLALDIAANKATICYIGTLVDNISFTVKQWEQLNRKELTLTGSWMSYSKEFPGIEWIETNKYFANNELVYIDEMIYDTYKLEEVSEVFNKINNKEVEGKVILINE